MDRNIKPTDQALDRLFKVLPADVTAAYLAIRSIVQIVSQTNQTFVLGSRILLVIIVILTLATPPFLLAMDIIRNKGQLVFLSLTFFIWAVNIDYANMLMIAPVGNGITLQYLIPIVLVLWAGLALPVYVHRTGA